MRSKKICGINAVDRKCVQKCKKVCYICPINSYKGGYFVDQYRDDAREVYSVKVRAGKRTYIFDVRATRGNDYYITITERKRRFNGDGFQKQKLFLYKEDFNKFLKSLNEVVDHVKTELLPDYDFEKFDREGDGYNDEEWDFEESES